MRFTLTLSTDLSSKSGNTLPINYQYELSSWIYKVLNSSDNDFARWLHETGYINQNRKFKLFTFSNLRPEKYKIEGDRLKIESGHTGLTISFYLPGVAEHFIKGLFMDQVIRLGDRYTSAEFRVSLVEKLNDPDFKRTMSFRTISPLTISRNDGTESKHAQYLSPDAPVYGELLINNLLNKYKALSDNGLINVKDSTLKTEGIIAFNLTDKSRQKLIRIKAGTAEETFIKGYIFSFTFDAPVELMRIGYYGGFGEKNSLGFGCCEII